MRIATFNAENLFSRAKVLNLRSNERSTELLEQIGQLQDELKKEIYDPVKILSLYKEVKNYISINEDRGKLFKRRGTAITGIKVKGKEEWDGEIVFRRESFSEMARKATAKVIRAMKPDVLCLVEVESRMTLDDFYGDILKTVNFRLPYNMCIDGFDPRHIDVGLMSKYPIKNIKTHIFDRETPTSRSCIFSRDCMEIELKISSHRSLYILCNHLKSKLQSASSDHNERRKKQAERIKEILNENYDLDTDWVIVAGDFNDTPDSAPLKPLLNMYKMHDVLELQYKTDMDKRWTYHYKKHEQIDYILISEALKDKFKSAGVERGGMYEIETLTKANEKRYSIIKEYKDSASDHAGVWAELDI